MATREEVQQQLFVFGVLIGIVFYFMLKLIAGLACCKSCRKTEQEAHDDLEAEPDDQIQDPDRYSSMRDTALFHAYPLDEVKMVLVVRTDLGMGKGKMAAQTGHATIGTFTNCKRFANKSNYWNKVLETWTHKRPETYIKKEILRARSENELISLQEECHEHSIPCYVVADSGHTQIEAGSLTVIGIGPVTA